MRLSARIRAFVIVTAAFFVSLPASSLNVRYASTAAW